jgi:hypothetical protein
MTKIQFKEKLSELGFKTHAQAAEALGVARTTITMWTTGANPVPESIVLFLKCLENGRSKVVQSSKNLTSPK